MSTGVPRHVLDDSPLQRRRLRRARRVQDRRPWSDGAFTELKTYGHACSEHLGLVFREAEQRREAYVPLPSETIEEIGIYKYEQGKRDRQLQRLWGLEENYRS